MGQIELPGNPSVAVALRRSPRARRLSLRVSRLDGRVTLTIPRGVSDAEGRRFVAEKADWITRALSKRPVETDVKIGATIPIEGVDRKIVAGTGKKVRLEGQSVAAPNGNTGPAIAGWLKARARAKVSERMAVHAKAVSRTPARLTLRDTRSRWGSCTSSGNLMLSWRLIMAPPLVLDYVVAHEVAHLIHMDHSPDFWSVVERLYPGWQSERDWLRTHGETLHRYRFD